MQNDTIADYIIHNLKELKDNYDNTKMIRMLCGGKANTVMTLLTA